MQLLAAVEPAGVAHESEEGGTFGDFLCLCHC